MQVTITADVQPLLARLAQFQGQATPALLRALVRTRDEATRPAMVEAVQSDTGLSALEVQSAITVQDPTRENPVAQLIASGKRVPIFDFGAQQTPTGVTYRLPGGRGFIPHAFIARMRSGHEGVFARRLPSVRRSRRAWSLNLPIVELRGPSVGRVIESRPQVVDVVTQRTLSALPAFLEQEIAALARETDLASTA